MLYESRRIVVGSRILNQLMCILHTRTKNLWYLRWEQQKLPFVDKRVTQPQHRVQILFNRTQHVVVNTTEEG